MAEHKAWLIADQTGPAADSYQVTPNDDADISCAHPNGVDTIVGARALRADIAGTIRVTTANGQVRDIEFAAGETRSVMVERVWRTGTTIADDSSGTNIEALV